MRFVTGFACIAVAIPLWSVGVFAQSPDAAAVLNAWAEAYASQDGARSAALYSDDASVWGTASRSPTVGRAGITEYFGRPREGVVSSSVTFDERETKPLGDGTVLAYGRYTFRQKRTDGTETALPARFSMVLAKAQDGSWRIVHHHSSPMPRPQ